MKFIENSFSNVVTAFETAATVIAMVAMAVTTTVMIETVATAVQ